jgi:hypothetical protein
MLKLFSRNRNISSLSTKNTLRYRTKMTLYTPKDINNKLTVVNNPLPIHTILTKFLENNDTNSQVYMKQLILNNIRLHNSDLTHRIRENVFHLFARYSTKLNMSIYSELILSLSIADRIQYLLYDNTYILTNTPIEIAMLCDNHEFIRISSEICNIPSGNDLNNSRWFWYYYALSNPDPDYDSDMDKVIDYIQNK